MTSPPTGLVTLLFADTERSAESWKRYGDAYHDTQRRLQDAGHECAERFQGCYANHSGDGFLLGFAEPLNALRCACALQRLVLSAEWQEAYAPLRLRIGLHTGMVSVYRDQYEGPTVWWAARVMAAGHGTQILLSADTHTLVVRDLTHSKMLCEDLGSYCLPGFLDSPVRLHRLTLADLPQSDHPPKALRAGAHNFDTEERPFVGRRSELDTLTESIRGHSARLITVLGMGGIGKTRLAMQAAMETADAFPDGVWLADMHPLQRREEIAPALCHALKIDPGRDADSAVRAALRNRQALLILDCFGGFKRSCRRDWRGFESRACSDVPGNHPPNSGSAGRSCSCPPASFAE